MRTSHKLFQMLACLQDYAELKAKGRTKRGVTGTMALAKEYNIAPHTLNRWAKQYQEDVDILGRDRAELIARIGKLEARVERLILKYGVAVAMKYKKEPSHMHYYRETKRLKEELAVFKELYTEQCDKSKYFQRRMAVFRTEKGRLKNAYDKLRASVERKASRRRGTSPRESDDVHKSP